MPQVITEVDEYTADVIEPLAGDPRVATSVQNGLRPLANRTKYLLGVAGTLADSVSDISDGFDTLAAGLQALAHATIAGNPDTTFDFYQYIPMVAYYDDAGLCLWKPANEAATGFGPTLVQDDVSAAHPIYVPIEFPVQWHNTAGGAIHYSWSLQSVTLTLKNPSASGSLPFIMPTLSLFVNGTIVGSAVTDGSASVGAYQASHTLVLTPNESMSASFPAHLKIAGETSTFSQTGLKLAAQIVCRWDLSLVAAP